MAEPSPTQIATNLLKGPVKALEGQTLYTVPQAKPFSIVEVFENHVWIKTAANRPRHIYIEDWEAAVEGYIAGQWNPVTRKQFYNGYNYSYINGIFRSPGVRSLLDKQKP